ncbi:MAG: hypothetical protein Q8K70_07920 [Bacteroidota bacterium]|nr:hypothetical protein [Bacteroidota bacterium]
MKQITKIACVLCLSAATLPSFAQNKKTSKKSPQASELAPLQNLHLSVYRNALQLSDYGSAIVALNYYLVANPNQLPYKDTLALLYLQTNQSVQAYTIVKQLQQEGRKSDMLTEILALSANALNQKTEATDAYQALYANTKNIQHGYALLQLQQQLKRVNEALFTCNMLLADTAINQATIAIADEKTKQEKAIALKAILYNIKGLLAYENKEYDVSIASFKESLSIAPDYSVASQNLKTISAIKESMEKIKTE